jgi:hypothetical protein
VTADIRASLKYFRQASVTVYMVYSVCRILILLLPINSQELFEVADADINAGITATTHHILAPIPV